MDPFARPLPDVDSHLARETTRRRALRSARDRREQDMLTGCADVERYEQQLGQLTDRIDLLFVERERAAANDRPPEDVT